MRSIPTKALLICGLFAGLLSPIVVLFQAWLREGFNLAVHPLSLLSLGKSGWIQITNFIVSGLLFIAFAFGLRRAVRSGLGRFWGPSLIGFYGVILIAAGVFTVDPMLGFPPGTPAGLPAALSWHAQVHNLTFLLAFLGLIVAQFVFARRFASIKQTGLALCSLGTGVTTPTLIVISQMVPAFSGYILFGAGLVVDVWVILLAMKMLAASRPPPQAAAQ